MQAELKTSCTSTFDFAVPVDKKGTVVYFSVNGHRYFFNGNTGLFYDSLAAYAQETFEVLKQPDEYHNAAFASLAKQYGSNCIDLVNQIRLFKNGTHPDLASESRQQHFFHRKYPDTIDILVSQHCNLACTYCSYQGGSFGKSRSYMSADTATHVLTFLNKLISKKTVSPVTVTLSGGEPLLAPEAVYTLVRGIHKLNRQNRKTGIRMMLCTNGTIYSKKIFEIFAERPDISRIAVSLDAFKDTQDKNRPFANASGCSPYDCVLGNLRRMDQEEIPYSVTCVVPYPYDFIGAANELSRLGFRCIEIKQLIHHIYGKPVLPAVFRREFNIWRKNYIAYSDFYIRHLNDNNPVRHVDRDGLFGDYAARLAHLQQGNRTLACGMGDSTISITADGKLLPCSNLFAHRQFQLGDVRSGFDRVKCDRFEQWLLSGGQHTVDSERCRNCYAKRICRGGCYAESIDKTKTLSLPDETFCLYKREMVKIDLHYIAQLKKHHPQYVSELIYKN